jgi:competence protein ComEC
VVRPHQIVLVGGLGCLLGIVLGAQLQLSLIPMGVAGILLIALLYFRPPAAVQVVCIFTIALLLGWWRSETIFSARPQVSDLNAQTLAVMGRVASDPAVSGNQQTLQLQITAVDEQPRQFKALLTAWHLPAFEYGDQLTGSLKFSLPVNSDKFNYSNYLAKDNIYITANQAGNLTSSPSTHPTLLGQMYRAKHWVNGSIHRFLPEPHSGLLAGLLLGVKSDLSDSFKTALKNSGTSHIVALSGFNVTIIITFLLLLLRRLPRRFVWIASGLLILIFVVMTGAASSVIRAAIMGWLLLLASLWGRRRSATNAILLAVVTMVLLHPLILFYDVGFQLSVGATLGLLYCSPLFLWRFRYVPKFISEAFAATIGATLFTLPLIALYFGGVSWVTLGANLLVVPLVPYVMLFGFVGLTLFLIVPGLQWLSLLVWPLSALLFSIINWFGNLPSAFIPLPALPVWVPILYYLVLGIIIVYVSNRRSSISSLV